MQNIIQYLMQNIDVLKKVREGKASLIGVNSGEQEAILNVFFSKQDDQETYYYWQ